MPRQTNKLTATKVRTAAPGRHGDGGGLYLLVRSTDARFWVFRYVRNGRMREMGLGPAAGRDAVALAVAREKATELRRLHKGGVDPLARRDADAARNRAEGQARLAQAMTFRTVADRYITANEAGWRNAKHAAQWRATLEAYAFPHMGEMPVSDVATAHVMAALEPIWHGKAETASRLRGRIESVLDYATARGWRSGENPARWRGHVANMLPKRSTIAPVEHHAALPWREIGTFMASLRQRDGVAARALLFTVLTAARSGEVRGARWNEFHVAEAVWTVPAARMKAKREHRVPLSAAASAVIQEATAQRLHDAADGLVFPGARAGKPLSDMSLTAVLRRMGRGDLTAHGFRSTFRDWCAEATDHPREIAEQALAHTLRDKVEAAYRRGDALEKRRRLMDDWTRFCARPATEAGAVTAIRRTG